MLRAEKLTRSGDSESVKRKTTRPRISRASSGRSITPRSSSPYMLGETPVETVLPSRTVGVSAGRRGGARARGLGLPGSE